MRIGILIGELKDCSNWQLRVIQTILNNPSLELTLIIQETKSHRNKDHDVFSHFFSNLRLGNLLFLLQEFIERSVFFKEVFSVDKESLIKRVAAVSKIKFDYKEKSPATVSNRERFQQIKEKTDLLINLGFKDCTNELTKISKHGVWDFSHADFSSPKTGPIGFLEVLFKKPSLGVALVKRIDGRQVELVDNTFFNREWSMVQSATTAQEGAVSVLFKNLKLLQSGHTFKISDATIPKYQSPRLVEVLKYLVQFYMNLLNKIIQKVAYTIWGRRHECWSVFIGKGSFLESSLSSMKPIEMPKDEFWADPFLFQHDDIDYVFFENYSYKTNRGKISCGKISGDKLIDIIDVLQLDYHMSFPFIFKEDGAIFLMPETSENKRLEIYKAVEFPSKWKLHTTAFEGEMVADAFFYDDDQDQKWLFVNKQAAETSPMNSELFIYKTDSIRLDNLQPHAQNPVIIDARVARNGGAIFKHMNESYRPSQRNTDGIYGRALNINRIKKLTINEYEEENVRICEPNFDKNLMATHHLHQTDELFVFDAAYSKK